MPLSVVLMASAAICLLAIGLWQWAALLLAVSLLLNWYSEVFAVHPIGNRIKGAGEIRILSYNLNRAYDFSKNEGTPSGLVRFIKRQEADIILFQEYNEELYPEIRKQLLPDFPYETERGNHIRFKSVYSKFPIEEYCQLSVRADDVRYQLLQHGWYSGCGSNGQEILPVCSFVVRIGIGRLRIVNCHLMSNNFSLVIREARKENRGILGVITQVMKRIDYGYAVRKLQAEIICQHLKEWCRDPVIVCGDFNDISGSPTLRRFKKEGLDDAWWKGGLGFGFTYHGMKLRLRLDHVLFSGSSLCLDKVFISHSRCSDHDPIVCDFKLRKT